MNKIIGIVGYPTENYFGASKTYLDFVNYFGEVVIINPVSLETFTNFYLPGLDMIILPGGGDIDVSRYGQVPKYFTYSANQFLEYFDKEILPTIIGKIPIVGICRGLQTLNVTLGGSLHQSVSHPYSSNHRGDLVHDVFTYPNYKKGFKVNSLHHQGISYLSKDLYPLAKAHDELIEAVINPKLKIFAVQWHPEEIWDDFTMENISKLLEK